MCKVLPAWVASRVMGEPTSAYSDFGGDLSALRRAAGLSVAELARAAHCSARNIRNLEAGTQRPQRGTLAHIAEAVGVSFERVSRTLAAVPVDAALSDAELDRLATRLAPFLVKAMLEEIQRQR